MLESELLTNKIYMESNNSNTTKLIWGIVAAIVITGLVLIAKKNFQPDIPKQEIAETETRQEPVASTTQTEVTKPTVKTATRVSIPIKKPAGNVVKYTETGFVPSVLIIKQGESVEFVNESDKAMVIRSHDENPENFYPGFSQEGGPLGKGGKFYFAFTIPGTWLYYNLNGNKEQGAIVVN